mgnify:CR=1 FL=1
MTKSPMKKKINPLTPVDLVIDHSVMVDHFGTKDAFKKNVAREFERNGERYSFLRWGQSAFDNFRVVPPGTGICHQVNLEYLSQTVWTAKVKEGKGTYGYNAATGSYGDMLDMGILDPTKVTRLALQNAASVAGLLLTTEVMVAEAPKDDDHKHGGMPDMGGMGGMGDMGM